MAKHMTLDTRKGIAHGLGCGLTFAEMAGMFHRAESTIANEVTPPSGSGTRSSSTARRPTAASPESSPSSI